MIHVTIDNTIEYVLSKGHFSVKHILLINVHKYAMWMFQYINLAFIQMYITIDIFLISLVFVNTKWQQFQKIHRTTNAQKYRKKNRIVTHDENNSGNSQYDFVVEFSSPATILSNQQSSSTSVSKETSSSSANHQKN